MWLRRAGVFASLVGLAAWLWSASASAGVEPALQPVRTYLVTADAPHLAQRYVERGGREPALFRNVSLGWPPGLADPAWWAAELGPTMERVARSSSGVFCFYKHDRPLAALPSVRRRRRPDEEPLSRMATAEFWRLWASAAPEDPFVSFSEVMHRLRSVKGSTEERFAPMVTPLGPLVVNDTRHEDRELFSATREGHSLRFWIASGGSRTLAHYDWSHNWYVMLQGSKRVVLFEPDAVDTLPFLHPYATKAVRDVLTLGPRVRGWEAVLDPGDVLYIPPLWLHDVTALSPAVALAVWSPSRDDGLSDALLAMGIPAGPDTDAQVLRVPFLWLAALLDAAFPARWTAAHFVRHYIMERRYAAVVHDAPELVMDQRWLATHCPSPEGSVGRYARARLAIPEARLTRAQELVNAMSPGGRALLLGNYVELVVNQLVNARADDKQVTSRPHLIPTLLHCLATWLEG